MPAQHLARQQSIARGSAQHAMHCFGFNSAKEGERAEGQQCKARSPKDYPEPAVPSEVLGAEGAAGHPLGHTGSLGTASHTRLETDPGKGPRVLLQHCRDPQRESIPCLLLYPEFIMHSLSIRGLQAHAPHLPPESPGEQAAHPRQDIVSTASLLALVHPFSLHKIQMVYSCWPPLP